MARTRHPYADRAFGAVTRFHLFSAPLTSRNFSHLHAECSSLNVFHVSPDGKRLLMATDTTDLPAPAFAFPVCYPTRRTCRRWNRRRADDGDHEAESREHGTTADVGDEVIEHVCREHRYEFVEFRQTRRGDEAESAVYRCSKCSHVRVR